MSRPPLESSQQGESKCAVYIVVKFIFDLFFKITFKTTPEPKHTRQIWIWAVKYSSFEVSDPTEVSRIVGKLIF